GQGFGCARRQPVPGGDGSAPADRQRAGDRSDEPLGEPYPGFGCATRTVEGVRGYQLRGHRLQAVRRVRLAPQTVRPVGSRALRATRVPRPLTLFDNLELLCKTSRSSRTRVSLAWDSPGATRPLFGTARVVRGVPSTQHMRMRPCGRHRAWS